MGIYDREYYREDGRSFLGSLAGRGRVVNALIAVNVVAFVVQIATQNAPGSVDGWFTNLFDLKPDKVFQGQVWRLLTAAFLHGMEWTHIVFNMVFLWWAGGEVEDIYGPREFLGFYLMAAVLSSAFYCITEMSTGRHGAALGASGAVTAVMMVFALHYPTRTIYMFWVVPVPLLGFVLLNVVQDSVGLLGRSGNPIAFAAHLGGAAFGFLYQRNHWRVLNWVPSFSGIKLPKRQPRLRVYREEPDDAPKPSRNPDEHLEAELDAVLAKVAKQGKGSLTDREQRVLMRASEIYRNRRK